VLGCPELLTSGSKGHENCHRRTAERHRHVAVSGVIEVPRGETPEALDMLSIEAIATSARRGRTTARWSCRQPQQVTPFSRDKELGESAGRAEMGLPSGYAPR
jgi:hypothetical protein